MSKLALVTGSNGFVGAGILHFLLDATDWSFLLPTTGLHQGSQARLNQVLRNYDKFRSSGSCPVHDRVRIARVDLTQPFGLDAFGDPDEIGYVNYVLNIASESHVDRSIDTPGPFIRNNVDLMINVLEFARNESVELVLQMSTDEVYGNARDGEEHVEWDPIRPSNPYSASKAAQEAIAYSYWRTYNVPLILTNTMNLIAPPDVSFQDTEKFIPKIMRNIRDGKPTTIHVDDNGKSGTRFWIDVRDFADAWLHIIRAFEDGVLPETSYMPTRPHTPPRFNIAGTERSNHDVATYLYEEAGLTPNLVPEHFHRTRPGHDPRYALDSSNLGNLGWSLKIPLEYTMYQIVSQYKARPYLLDS